MNAQIGKNKNNKFSQQSSSNRNEEHLKDFSLENGQTYFNFKFQKRKRKLWTYTYANNAKALIDCILMNKKWINIVRYIPLLYVSSDHRIVTAKIRLSLRRNMAQTVKTTYYKWSMFNNRGISNKYKITLRDKFNVFQEISETLTPNDEYEDFIMEAAAKCILTKLRAKHRVPWETLAVKSKRENSIPM